MCLVYKRLCIRSGRQLKPCMLMSARVFVCLRVCICGMSVCFSVCFAGWPSGCLVRLYVLATSSFVRGLFELRLCLCVGAPHELAAHTCLYVCIHNHIPKNKFGITKVFLCGAIRGFVSPTVCFCVSVWMMHIFGWLSGWLTIHESLKHTAAPEACQKQHVLYMYIYAHHQMHVGVCATLCLCKWEFVRPWSTACKQVLLMWSELQPLHPVWVYNHTFGGLSAAQMIGAGAKLRICSKGLCTYPTVSVGLSKLVLYIKLN